MKKDSSNEKNLFSILENLDSDTGTLKSAQTGKLCDRDIVDLIKINEFLHDQSKITLARETFAEIPNHFIEYMSKKGIKPSKEKKNLKAGTDQPANSTRTLNDTWITVQFLPKMTHSGIARSNLFNVSAALFWPVH